MDSGNSGSMQSSSGGGSEEYDDSRAESISAFLNNNASSHNIGHGGHLVHHQPSQAAPSLRHHQQHQSLFSSSSAMFDPFSNYFDHPLTSSRSSPHLITTTNPLFNLDHDHVVWSAKNPRSHDNLGGFMTNQQEAPQSRATTFNPCMAQIIPQGVQESAGITKSSVSGTISHDHQPTNNKNPKKRSRASRRAPTTVLTTDTNNFRAMVQEFTGIPAPPFTSSSPFSRTNRLDLFGTSSNHLDSSPPPHYLLRPFAQKISFPGASSNSTSINYQQLPISSSDEIAGLLKLQPAAQSLFNNMNPILNFQSLLQTPPNCKYPLPNSTDSPLKMGVLEEFGLSQPQGGHVDVVSTTNLTGGDSTNRPSNWREEPADGGYNSNRLRVSSNGKLNNLVSASSSDFHGDKGTENVASYER